MVYPHQQFVTKMKDDWTIIRSRIYVGPAVKVGSAQIRCYCYAVFLALSQSKERKRKGRKEGGVRWLKETMLSL
jgi:hypothetical protein